MRIPIVVAAALLLTPTAVRAQAGSIAYRPSPVAAGLSAEAARIQSARDTVEVRVDPYGVDDSVVYGAAIGGIVGGLAVVAHTISDDQKEPLDWAVAVSAPIVGGLIGAGVGWLLK